MPPSVSRPAIRRLAVAAGGLLVAAAGSAAFAQMSAMPADLAAAIQAGGRKVDIAAGAALYAPLQDKEPYGEVKVVRDLAYGPDPLNRADVFLPQTPRTAQSPILLFVHGGGFNTGGKRLGPASPFYDNLGVWAARHHMIGVTIDYRLAPQSPWPAGPQDVAKAVAWAKRSAAQWGGDPDAIFLVGHSAGSAHIAAYLTHAEFQPGGHSGVRGAVLVSGAYTVNPVEGGPPDEASFAARDKVYYGTDPSRYAEESSFAGLVKSATPLLFVNAELDPLLFRREADRLQAALQQAGRPGRFLVLKGHNHISQVLGVNTADHELSDAIDQFIRDHR